MLRQGAGPAKERHLSDGRLPRWVAVGRAGAAVHRERAVQVGPDVRTDGERAWVDVTEPREYELERGAGTRVLALSPDRAGLEVHAFVLSDPVRRE